MQRLFKRDVSALTNVFEFTADFVRAHKLDTSAAFAMDLAVEELFTNMVKYGAEHDNDVSIELEVRAGNLVIKLTDFDVDHFDVTSQGDVNVNEGLDERVPGGLGLHLVKSVMDDISYEYTDRNSIITLTKRLEESDV